MGNPIILLEVTSINDNALSTATNYAFVVDQIGTIVANGSGSDLMYRSPQSVPTRFTVSQSPSDIVALAASETPSEIIDSISASVTAFAGGGQGSATQLTSTVNNVTTVATAGDSVKLPEAVAGLVVIVQNNGANAADVFPATGETINSGSANAAVALPVGARMEFIGTTTSNWTTDRSYALIANIVGSKEVDHVFSVTDTSTAATAGGAITITAGKAGTSGAGGAAAVNGGVGGTTGTGGAVNITSGAGGTTSGNSGAVNVKTANETATDSSGNVVVASGTTASANSGTVSVTTGVVSTSGNSGALTVGSGASSASGDTGALQITTGAAASGTSGLANIATGTGTTASGVVTITTGNATTTSGAVTITTGTGTTSGNIILAPGTGSSVTGMVVANKNFIQKHTTSAINSTGTATALQIANGWITSTSAAGTSITTPTATEIAAGIGGAALGTVIDLVIDNNTGANTVTLVLDASITVVTPVVTGQDTLTVSTANDFGWFRIMFTSATTARIFRVC